VGGKLGAAMGGATAAPASTGGRLLGEAFGRAAVSGLTRLAVQGGTLDWQAVAADTVSGLVYGGVEQVAKAERVRALARRSARADSPQGERLMPVAARTEAASDEQDAVSNYIIHFLENEAGEEAPVFISKQRLAQARADLTKRLKEAYEPYMAVRKRVKGFRDLAYNDSSPIDRYFSIPVGDALNGFWEGMVGAAQTIGGLVTDPGRAAAIPGAVREGVEMAQLFSSAINNDAEFRGLITRFAKDYWDTMPNAERGGLAAGAAMQVALTALTLGASSSATGASAGTQLLRGLKLGDKAETLARLAQGGERLFGAMYQLALLAEVSQGLDLGKPETANSFVPETTIDGFLYIAAFGTKRPPYILEKYLTRLSKELGTDYQPILTVRQATREKLYGEYYDKAAKQHFYYDPADGTRKFLDRTELSIDHIVPIAMLLDRDFIPGVEKLTLKEIGELIQDPGGRLGNLQVLPREINSSKGNRLAAAFIDYKQGDRRVQISPEQLTRQVERETQILKRVRSWVSEQTAARPELHPRYGDHI
jgi:hypothetical protein